MLNFEGVQWYGAKHLRTGDHTNLQEQAQGMPWLRLFSITSRVVDMIAPTSSEPLLDTFSDRSGDSRVTAHDWNDLWFDLDGWYAEVPAYFKPYVRYQPSGHIGVAVGSPEVPFCEILFTTPVAGATMIHYHFTCILLLLKKPIEQLSPVAQLKSYRDLAKEVENHCLEICGIAAGRPSAAARIQIIQPLVLAGQCLEGHQKRKGVIQLLREIEFDIGWPTGQLITQLQQYWGGDDTLPRSPTRSQHHH